MNNNHGEEFKVFFFLKYNLTPNQISREYKIAFLIRLSINSILNKLSELMFSSTIFLKMHKILWEQK